MLELKVWNSKTTLGHKNISLYDYTCGMIIHVHVVCETKLCYSGTIKIINVIIYISLNDKALINHSIMVLSQLQHTHTVLPLNLRTMANEQRVISERWYFLGLFHDISNVHIRCVVTYRYTYILVPLITFKTNRCEYHDFQHGKNQVSTVCISIFIPWNSKDPLLFVHNRIITKCHYMHLSSSAVAAVMVDFEITDSTVW